MGILAEKRKFPALKEKFGITNEELKEEIKKVKKETKLGAKVVSKVKKTK